MLGVGPLLAQVRLPEPVQQGLREPRYQWSAGLGGGAKDGFPDVGFYEVLPVELGVAEVGVGVSVRELQAGDPPGQVCGQAGEIGEIKNQLGYA